MQGNLPVFVFSHLRWDFVYQRPQHLLSRLAQRRPVFFIEEPILKPSQAPSWEHHQPEPGLTVCRPCTPLEAPGFSDEQFEPLGQLVAQLLRDQALADYAVWFYTPMALPLLKHLRPKAVIYDCMDELSMFKFAPPQLLDREAELLKRADVVFTGGPSLYRAKKDRHPNVHCFPSSVDARHFAQAQDRAIEAEDQKHLPRPRLGFYGVIDERMDLALLDKMAQAHGDWQIVMVGPVVKIEPADLPRRPNLHFLGQRTYQQLPGYLAGWDVCLLPFARNDSTRFISPTKTLEYMAAQRPIVSTPITDVAEPYGQSVYLGDTPGAFIAACEQALASPADERQRRAGLMQAVLAKTSWDRTAAQIDALIDQAMEEAGMRARYAYWARPVPAEELADANPPPGRPGGGGSRRRTSIGGSATSRTGAGDAADQASTAPAAPASDGPRHPGASHVPVVVAGAGPTGLSATYHLGKDALLIEKNDRVGGWCRSIQDRGFTFDHAGHIMFSNDPYVHEMYKMLLGDNVHWQDREAWIYSKGVYTRYPFQGCLYGLPADVIAECIVGAIEARFGTLKPRQQMEDAVAKSAQRGKEPEPRLHESPVLPADCQTSDALHRGSGGYSNAVRPNGNGKSRLAAAREPLAFDPDGDVKDCCGDGILEAEAPLMRRTAAGDGAASPPSGEPRSFEEFIYQVWGKGIAKHFAIPYNRKLWAVPLSEMETSWLGGRVPMPDIEEMIKYSLSPAAKPMGPNARFGYPLRGGFQALMEGFLPHIQDRLRLNTAIVGFSPRRKTVTLGDGSTVRYDYLISTMPLPLLIKMAGDEVPAAVRQAAAGLRHISVRCVNIGVGREKISDKHWIYYPEDTIFHRIFVQGNASPHCNPPPPEVGFGFTCEITYSPQYKPLPVEGEALIQRCIADAIKVGFIRQDDPILCANQVDMPFAYVVYDHDRPRHVKTIQRWLEAHDVILAGRYSQWEYYNSDHAFVAGKRAAEQIRELQAQRAGAAGAGNGKSGGNASTGNSSAATIVMPGRSTTPVAAARGAAAQKA